MLTALDAELYPEDCEVVEMPLHDQWIFLIQKNGNSSLRFHAAEFGYPKLVNEEIRNLDTIDIYVRDPRDRYISGVNTFLTHLKNDNPELDWDTCCYMATRYRFLNRHYLPQFCWLVNLARYIKPTCQLRFHDFQELRNLVYINSRAGIIPVTEEQKQKILKNQTQLEFWFFIDQILLNLVGKSQTWAELLNHYRINHYHHYHLLSRTFIEIANVLSKT